MFWRLDGLPLFCILENMGIPKKIKEWVECQEKDTQELIGHLLGAGLFAAVILTLKYCDVL